MKRDTELAPKDAPVTIGLLAIPLTVKSKALAELDTPSLSVRLIEVEEVTAATVSSGEIPSVGVIGPAEDRVFDFRSLTGPTRVTSGVSPVPIGVPSVKVTVLPEIEILVTVFPATSKSEDWTPVTDSLNVILIVLVETVLAPVRDGGEVSSTTDTDSGPKLTILLTLGAESSNVPADSA